TKGSLVTSATGNIDLAALNTISGLTTTTNGVTTTAQLSINTTSLTANTTNGDIDLNDKISLTSTLTLSQLNAGGSFNLSSGGSITTSGFTGGVGGGGGGASGFDGGTVATANISGSLTAGAAINGQYSAPLVNAKSPRYIEVNKFIFKCVEATMSFSNVINLTVGSPSSNSPMAMGAKSLAQNQST